MRFESILQCVECKKNLNKIKDGYVCVNKHKFLGGIPDFIVDKKGLKDEFNAQKMQLEIMKAFKLIKQLR